MKDWLKDEDLSDAFAMVSFAETFAKSVKAVVKAKLEEDENSVPGYKLRGGGTTTSYDAKEVADIIMDSNVIGWNDLLEAMKFSLTPFVKVWSEHTGMTPKEAKKDLSERLQKIQRVKPRSPSVIKSKK